MESGATHDADLWLDLISEMQALVWEQAPLHEITHQVIDHLGHDQDVVHGPWEPEQCQAVLVPWLERGLVELIADAEPPWQEETAPWRARADRQGAYLVLSKDDAISLLQQPERWQIETPDGYVMLSRSRAGDGEPPTEWSALAERHLPAANDIDGDRARSSAEAVIADWPVADDPADRVVVWNVEERPHAWVVYFATQRWVASRDFRDQLVGACPFVVSKATGRLHEYGSRPDEYARFQRWLAD